MVLEVLSVGDFGSSSALSVTLTISWLSLLHTRNARDGSHLLARVMLATGEQVLHRFKLVGLDGLASERSLLVIYIRITQRLFGGKLLLTYLQPGQTRWLCFQESHCPDAPRSQQSG